MLYKNAFFDCQCDPDSDILAIAYPDLYPHLLPEILCSIEILSDKIKKYGIRGLLLDASSTMLFVSTEETREVAMYLAAGLAETQLQKVARLQYQVATVEARAKANIRFIMQYFSLPYELRSFTDKGEALAWLKAAELSAEPAV